MRFTSPRSLATCQVPTSSRFPYRPYSPSPFNIPPPPNSKSRTRTFQQPNKSQPTPVSTFVRTISPRPPPRPPRNSSLVSKSRPWLRVPWSRRRDVHTHTHKRNPKEKMRRNRQNYRRNREKIFLAALFQCFVPSIPRCVASHTTASPPRLSTYTRIISTARPACLSRRALTPFLIVSASAAAL